MSMNTMPLRYRIADWHQLHGCVSNNSRKLHIEVTDFINNRKLTGVRISVIHQEFGVLFSCVVGCRGELLSGVETHLDVPFELSYKDILAELQKYGFLVEYRPAKHLLSGQIELLMKVKAFKFDKIRILNVCTTANGIKEFNWRVVAFNVKSHPYWLNSDYAPSEKEYLEALDEGTAVNVTAMSNNNMWDWSWLYGFVANIDDILEENSL